MKEERKERSKKDYELTSLIDKISGLSMSEPHHLDLTTNGIGSSSSTLIFFLTETYEHHFESLLKDIKKCFFSPFDLKKIEVYSSNYENLMVGKVFYSYKHSNSLQKSKSSLFTCEYGKELFSKRLKGNLKTFSDLTPCTKVKELISY